MVWMHNKSPLLQHPLTKCHIITLREMQKIKMNTHIPNQNKYNTKNTLASRPSRPTLAVGQASMPAVVWRVRRARQPTGLGLASCDLPKSASKLNSNAPKPVANALKLISNASKCIFFYSNLKPRDRKLIH
jgi:hypothetical protein